MLASLLGRYRKRFEYQRSGSVHDRGPPPAILCKRELLPSTSEIRWRLAGHSERARCRTRLSRRMCCPQPLGVAAGIKDALPCEEGIARLHGTSHVLAVELDGGYGRS